MSFYGVSLGAHGLNLKTSTKHVIEFILEDFGHPFMIRGVDSCPRAGTAKGKFVRAHTKDGAWAERYQVLELFHRWFFKYLFLLSIFRRVNSP